MKTYAPVRDTSKSAAARPADKAGLAPHPHAVQASLLLSAPQRALHDFSRMTLAPNSDRPNRTGLPDHLKAGIEHLSGLAMDDVRVHYNSPKPAQLQALAYAEGADIHVGPGQQRHLPHEAWHVVQQKQGRVKPTLQVKGVVINNEPGPGGKANAAGRSFSHFQRTPDPLIFPAGYPLPNRDLKGVIQPKLAIGNNTYQTVAELKLPDEPPSPVVARLLDHKETYYLPDNPIPSFKEPNIQALEQKKYLLGEWHDEKTVGGAPEWEARTKPWKYVPKMREMHKELPSESEKERELIDATKDPNRGDDLPLESAHAYLLTATLILQGNLKDPDLLSTRASLAAFLDPESKATTTASHAMSEARHWAKEVYHHLARYSRAASKLTDLEKWKTDYYNTELDAHEPHTRGWLLVQIGFLTNKSSYKKMFKMVEQNEIPDPKDILQIQALLKQLHDYLIEIIDTRKKGFFGNKKGIDPVPNRAAIAKMADPKTADADKFGDILHEANQLRDPAMVRNIKAATAPLLVQVGNAHLPQLKLSLADEAVAVPKDVDFVALTTKS